MRLLIPISRKCPHLRALLYLVALLGSPSAATAVEGSEPSDLSTRTSDEAAPLVEASDTRFVDLLLAKRLETPLSIDETSGFSLSLSGGVMHSTNAYGNSNLALGTRITGQEDQIADVALAARAHLSLSGSDRVSLDGTIGRTMFLKRGELSFNSGSLALNISTRRVKPFQVSVGYGCAREFDNGLIYRNCGPDGSVKLANDLSRNLRFSLDATGFYKRGRSLFFENYHGGRLSAVIATSGRSSFYGGAQYMFRQFDGGYGRILGLPDRRDHRISIHAGVEHSLSQRVFLGFHANGSMNWSNYDEYRYWDISFGPRLRIEVL